ncbi:MAG: HigA family addiction module antitoxin [Acetobacter orientalis]|uniref:HigA family addiction module antitoxin n=1 Tax=Acetobacter orientalis TaxID=146474 RepID=UPI0039E9831B
MIWILEILECLARSSTSAFHKPLKNAEHPTPNKHPPHHNPTHPGTLQREDVLPAYGATEAKLAAQLGITAQTLAGILAAQQPVTPAIAARLGILFGNGPALWLGLQTQYDRVQYTQATD